MAKHITELNIESYKGITGLEIKDLGDVNILVGDNNSGKTSVLEIINTLGDLNDLGKWSSNTRRNRFISLLPFDAFNLLFNKNDETKKEIRFSILENSNKIYFSIKGHIESYEMTEKEIDKILKNRFSSASEQLSVLDSEINEYEENGSNDEADDKMVTVEKLILDFDCKDSVKSRFSSQKDVWNFQKHLGFSKMPHQIVEVTSISPTQHSDGNLFLSDVLDDSVLYLEMIEVLKEFDDKIISLNADRTSNPFSLNPVYKILSSNFKEAMPLSTYGDGTKKAILLMSAVIKASDGILLIDEFETALHTKAMNKVFSWIVATCKKLNVQLFMTTHSIEAVDKILNCNENELGNIRIITLEKKANKTYARVLNGHDAHEYRENLEMELRI